jgi:hypothetical protein
VANIIHQCGESISMLVQYNPDSECAFFFFRVSGRGTSRRVGFVSRARLILYSVLVHLLLSLSSTSQQSSPGQTGRWPKSRRHARTRGPRGKAARAPSPSPHQTGGDVKRETAPTEAASLRRRATRPRAPPVSSRPC